MKAFTPIFIAFLLATAQVYASDKEGILDNKEDPRNNVSRNGEDNSDPFANRINPALPLMGQVPPELMERIFYYSLSKTSPDTLKMLEDISSTETATRYATNTINLLLGQTNIFAPILSHQITARLQSLIRQCPGMDYLFMKRLEEKMTQDSFLFFPEGSPLSLTRCDCESFESLYQGDVKEILPWAYPLYTAAFNHPLPVRTEEQSRTALNQLEAVCPLQGPYFLRDPEAKAEGVKRFFATHADTLINKLEERRTQQLYCDLGNPHANLKALAHQNHTIVVLKEQLKDRELSSQLQDILKVNPEHTLLLSVASNPILRTPDIPDETRHLRVVNPRGDVRIIRKDFFFSGKNLRSFDCRLGNVVKIEECFFYHHEDLSSCKLDLFNLKEIEEACLIHCSKLRFFDTSALANLEKIGRSFLLCCGQLSSFDSSALTSVKSIGESFLKGTRRLSQEDNNGIDLLLKKVAERNSLTQ